jgi:hypothetical protein
MGNSAEIAAVRAEICIRDLQIWSREFMVTIRTKTTKFLLWRENRNRKHWITKCKSVCTCTEKAVEKFTLNKKLNRLIFLLSMWLNIENCGCHIERSHEENNLRLSKRSPGTAIYSISGDNIRTTSLSWRPRELCWRESKLLVGPPIPDRSKGRDQKKCSP